MYRKALFFISALVFATVANAEGVVIDSRFDNNSTSYNDAAIAAGSKANSSFQGNRLRFLLSSKINDDLNAKVRLNLLTANDTPSTEAKYSKYIDYAFITHKFTPEFYITAGKVIALIGGQEAIVNPADYYFVSVAGQEILSRPLTALWPVGTIIGTVI
jgi:hypothetical protein